MLPTSTEQNLYGGIYRDVELIVTDKTTISPLYYGTEGVIVTPSKVTTESVTGNIGISLLGKKDALCSVNLDIISPDGYVSVTKNIKAKLDGKLLNIPFTINNPELWSTHKPALYNVEVVVGNDTVSIHTGFRNLVITPQNLLTINDKQVPIRGVNHLHDNNKVGNALTEEDYIADMAIIEEMGVNAIRSVGGPHDQILYDMCDRNGTLVWIDSPLCQSPFLSDIAYYASDAFKDNGREQLKEIILQNIHHPSVAMWGIFSHLRGRSADLMEYIKELNALAKQTDPSRPTVACSNQDGDINFITDLIVWQQSVGWDKGATEDLDLWQNALRTNWNHLCQAVCYGEAGVRGLYNDIFLNKSAGQHRIPESWQTHFHEDYIARIDTSLFWGIWLNSMFDFGAVRHNGGVRNSGMVAFDHNQRKDVFYLYKTLWNKRTPTLHIVGKDRDVRLNNLQAIQLYCSHGVPSVIINGDSVAVHNRAQGIFVTDSMTMSGHTNVVVTTPELRDSTTFTVGRYLRRK